MCFSRVAGNSGVIASLQEGGFPLRWEGRGFPLSIIGRNREWNKRAYLHFPLSAEPARERFKTLSYLCIRRTGRCGRQADYWNRAALRRAGVAHHCTYSPLFLHFMGLLHFSFPSNGTNVRLRATPRPPFTAGHRTVKTVHHPSVT